MQPHIVFSSVPYIQGRFYHLVQIHFNCSLNKDIPDRFFVWVHTVVISEVWIPGKQCTHLAPKKNYIIMNVHSASELWAALSTVLSSVRDLWMTNGISFYQTLKQQYPNIPSVFFLLLLSCYFSLLILGMILETIILNYLI